MLYDPPDFKNGLAIDALLDSSAYVIVIAWNDLERSINMPRANNFKIDDNLNFQIQVANV